MNDQLADDLRKNFASRLRLLVIDTADTCRRADVSIEETFNLVVSELTFELLLAVLASSTDKKQFLSFCGISYDEMSKYMLDKYRDMERQRSVH